MRFGGIALGLSVCGMAGCSAPRQVYQPAQPPIELSGPTCPRDGPSVEAENSRFVSCGKGDTCTVVDHHVRNPTAQALWLLLDGDADFFRGVEDVRLLHPWSEPQVAVWQFSGQSVAMAVRVPADADVVLRDLESTKRLTEFRAVFLDQISVAQYRDIGTLEPRALVPVRGKVTLDGIGGFISRHQSRSLHQFHPMALASIRVRCVLSLPIPQG